MKQKFHQGEFIIKHFPLVLYAHASEDYKNSDFYSDSKKFLKTYFDFFKKISKNKLIIVFACLIKSIKENREGLDQTWTSETFKLKGVANKEFHKNILDLEKVFLSFYYEYALKEMGIFPIKKIVFEGQKKELKTEKTDQIILKGGILEFVGDIFRAFDNLKNLGKEDRIQLSMIASELSSVYDRYSSGLLILKDNEGTMAERLVKVREETDKETAFNMYRNGMAYYINLFLKKFSKENSEAKIPAWHKKFIGDFFGMIFNLKEFSNDHKAKTYDKVAHWINDGKP